MPTRAETAAAVALLVERQAAGRDRIGAGAFLAVRRILSNFSAWYVDREVRRMAAEVAGVVRPAQDAAAALTDAYLTTVLDQYDALPRRIQPVSLPDEPRGLDPVDVYERVAKEYRYQRSLDLSDAIALERATQRAEVIVQDDVDLGMREAARQRFVDTPNVTGYRRVIHPELSRTGTCGLCAVASDRIYVKSDLMPIHGRCRCEALPIFGEEDPGRAMNAADLRQLYDAAGGTTSGAALKRVRVTVQEHGELGPVLRRADWDFRTQEQAEDDQAPRKNP